jgi:hypothetical protein
MQGSRVLAQIAGLWLSRRASEQIDKPPLWVPRTIREAV